MGKEKVTTTMMKHNQGAGDVQTRSVSVGNYSALGECTSLFFHHKQFVGLCEYGEL